MNPHHEHEFEVMPGLPEALPRDEHVVWQGVPSASLLAVHVFHLRKLIAYFAFMLLIQILYLMGEPGADVWPSVGLSAVLALDDTASRSSSFAPAAITIRSRR